MKAHRVSVGVTALALSTLIATSVTAQQYHWPDKIPPEAVELLKSPPLSPHGQPVPGFPDGPPATSPDVFNFTPEMIAKLKAGPLYGGHRAAHYGRGLAEAAGRRHHQHAEGISASMWWR